MILQLILLGLTFACLGLVFLSGVGYFSGTIGSWITRRPRYTQFLVRLSGAILIGLGVRLALTEKK